MSKFIVLISFLISSSCWAVDCSSVKPFLPNDQQSVDVNITRFYWSIAGRTEEQQEQNVCSLRVNIYSYDIRGRENEAYWCLKPQPQEIVSCPVVFDGEPSEIVVIPSIWIRQDKGINLRGYQFHAYLFKKNDQSMWLHDVFARAQLTNLAATPLFLDGAYRDGFGSYRDGYSVGASFR